MNLLGAVYYDPAGAVSKATSSLLAMTAFDTTNLRVTVTVPAHGYLRFRISGPCFLGATTFPQVFLGVMTGATVVCRSTPLGAILGTAIATTHVPITMDMVVGGLTPGSTAYDAAYAVQVVIASTNIKYGGPNDASGADAFGGFSFEIWDPRPIPTAAPGASGGLLISGSNAGTTTLGALTVTGAFSNNGTTDVAQTGDNYAICKSGGTGDNAAIKAKTDNLPAAPASTTNITAGTITTVTNLTNAPTNGDLTATMKTSVTTAATSATPTAAAVTGAVGSVTGNVGGNVVGSVGSVTGAVGSVTGAVGSVTGAVGSVTGSVGGNVTGSVGSVVGLTASNLDATVSSRLASASYTAPDNTSITAIKAKTDSLTFTSAGKVDANALKINGVTVNGVGTSGNPWGP